MSLTVAAVDRIPVRIPFREVPGRNLIRNQPNWKYFEIVEVELEDGSTGYGEAMLDYWSRTLEDESVDRTLGANAASLMWDDSLGWAIQSALFDAVGRSLGVPIHELIGDRVNETTPLSWWCIDMPPEDWVSEAQLAIDRGYTAMKVKGRPWFDLREQIEQLASAVPESFSIDVDFNDTLLDAGRAIPILRELDEHPQVNIYETPIPQGDVEGNKQIREAVDGDIAMHYGTPEPTTALCEGVCDGFVVTGTASKLTRMGSVAAMADRPLFLQLVGSGITAAHSLHFGGVMAEARWPAINCHQIYEDDLLADPIEVEDGRAAVPDEPGLGHDVNRDAIERYRVAEDEVFEEPDRLIEVEWPDHPTMYFASRRGQLMSAARSGELPYFERDVRTRVIPDDGSDWWAETFESATESPVVVED